MLGLLANRGSGDDSSAAAVDGALAKINRVLPVDAAPSGRGARGDARLHDGRGGRAAPTPARCCCSRTRSAGAGDGCTSPIARSPETSRSASSARTASSSTAAAGTSPRTTTCATTCARSASTGCGAPRSTDAAALPPPAGFDPVEHVTRSLASVPWKWEVEVLLDLPVDEAARRIPRDAGRDRRRPRRHPAADAGRLARLDGDRPRRARLRFHGPSAGRAADEHPRAGDAPGGAGGPASRGRRRSPAAARRRAAARRGRARPAGARAPS